MEIERKYLFNTLPFELNQLPYKQVEQGYIASMPTIRIRRMDNDYFLTVKSKGTLVRHEYEMPISKKEYEHLIPKVDSKFIQKKRYYLPLTEVLTAEIDIFEGEYAGLKVVEVEFPNVEMANNFTPPEWFGEDVTEKIDYTNMALAYRSLFDYSKK